MDMCLKEGQTFTTDSGDVKTSLLARIDKVNWSPIRKMLNYAVAVYLDEGTMAEDIRVVTIQIHIAESTPGDDSWGQFSEDALEEEGVSPAKRAQTHFLTHRHILFDMETNIYSEGSLVYGDVWELSA